MVIINREENHCARQNWEALTPNLVGFQHNVPFLDG